MKKKHKKNLNYFLEVSEEFRRDSKRNQISHGKRTIGVPAIEVWLYAKIRPFFDVRFIYLLF